MKLPEFKITSTMETLALEIVDLMKHLSSLGTDKKFLHLRKDNRLKSIQSSLAIEANSLSLQQVTDIINGKKVVGDVREILEVKNAWAAYEKIEHYDPFSLESLLEAHALLSNQLVKDSGVFRTMQVNVYKGFELIHAGAKPKEILSLMTELFDWARGSNINAIIKSCIIHFIIEYIHPFEDGNGRIGRLWQTVILHSWDKNFQWIPIETMVYQNQQGYYTALQLSSQQHNANPFIEFMLGIIKFTLENIIESRNIKRKKKKSSFEDLGIKLGIKLGINQQLILKEIEKNPFITAAEIAHKINISKTAVENNIAKLKELGVLQRVGARKNGYWKIG
jgi:Fic family protein